MVELTKSPFPGMDPFLERYWDILHNRLCPLAADAINEHLGDEYVADANARVIVQDSGLVRRRIEPDVRILDDEIVPSADTTAPASPTALAVPTLSVQFADEPMRQPFVEILTVEGDQVVTIIEFISPTNKRPGPGQDLYEQKQRECLESGVNLVEIDLTRAGRRRFVGERLLERVKSPPERHVYEAGVLAVAPAARFSLYPLPITSPLSRLGVPVTRDFVVPLDLQAVLDRAYELCRFGRRLDYASDLHPPLPADLAAWADKLLRDAGRR